MNIDPHLSLEEHGEPLADVPSDDELILRIELAASRALENLREARRRQWLGLIGISSTIVLILGSISGFLINELLDLRVRERVEAVIDQELVDTRFNMELARLTLSSTELKLQLEDFGVEKDDLERMRNDLEAVVKSYLRDSNVDPKPQQDRERAIVPLLADLIEISAGTGADQYVDEIYNLAPDILKDSDSVTQTMVQHIGRELIGNAGAPRNWRSVDGEFTEKYKLYKTFSERARVTGYPELYLAFEMVVRYMDGVTAAEIEDLIDDAKTLNEVDRQQFVRLMVVHADGQFAHVENASVTRVEEKFSAFLNEYEDFKDWIYAQ